MLSWPLVKWLRFNLDITIVNVILLVKILIVSRWVGETGNSFWVLSCSIATLALLSSWIGLLTGRLRVGIVLLYHMVITLLIIADLMFFRFFHRILPIPALSQIDQLTGISQSVSQGFNISYFLFAADIVVIIPLLAYIHSRGQRTNLVFGLRFLQFVAVVSISCAIILFRLNGVTKVYGKENTQNLYSNNVVIHTMGVLDFHLFDTYNNLMDTSKLQVNPGDLLDIRGWMMTHRQRDRKLFGAARGKNLIVIQMESTQQFLINRCIDGQEITPNLNKLSKESLYFDNIFVQVAQGNSSDAEFMSLNSLYPAGGGVNYLNYASNYYQSLPLLLKKQGYSTLAIHGDVGSFWNRNLIYPSLGIDAFYSRSALKNDEVIGMGLSDRTVFTQASTILENSQTPFMALIISLSGHYPYEIPESAQSLKISRGKYSKVFSNYLQAQHYADQALEILLDKLKKDGILDNSILVVYGDHFAAGDMDRDISAFTGQPQKDELDQLELRKVPLIIRLPKGADAGNKHQVGGQMDIMPTVANLLGINNSNRYYFGQDLLNQADGFAAFRYYEPDGSFVTQRYFYIANWDGIFEHGRAYDRQTGKPVDVELCRQGYEEAKKQLKMSDKIVQQNLMGKLISTKK